MSDSPVQPEQNISLPQETVKLKISKRKVYIIVAVFLMVIVGIVVFFIMQKKGFSTSSDNKPTQQSKTSDKKPDAPIAKVGNETIYQSDLNEELKSFAGAKENPQMRKLLLNKLVKDSITLQAAQKEKLVTLNDTVYNSANKDYMKRIEDIKNVKKKIDSNVAQISGTLVSVWFHNQTPAKIGLIKGKEEALKKITALHDKVTNKEITIEDAGRLIIADASYADLDPYGYKNNAIITFSVSKEKQITIDSGFDEILWNTKVGEITPVYLGKTINYANQGPVEAYYIFGVVKKKIDTQTSQDFTSWYNTQKNTYEVTYY